MNDFVQPAVPRILVIDDTRAIHEDFRKIFAASRQGAAAASAAELGLFGGDKTCALAPEFQVDSAYQGEEGLALVELALVQGRPYALAFVDVRMPPGLDGIETAARICASDADIQIVICTAYSDYSWGEMLSRLGRSDRLVILKKPFDTVEVLQLASALTEKWRVARLWRTTFEGLESRVAERTRELVDAGERLRASAAQYRLLFDSNPHPMWVYDLQTLGFLAVNAAALQQYGYSEVQFKAMTLRDIRPPEDVAAMELAQDGIRRQGKHFGVWRHRRRDGSLIDVEISSDKIAFDGRAARLVLAHDVTERRRAEAGVKRLNRVYAVLSGISTLIVRAGNREELFKGACRIAVEVGGFAMAAIGIVDRATMAIVPGASAGMDPELLAAVTQLVSSREHSAATLVARALREKEAVISNDVQGDPQVLLGARYADAGVRSMVILPLLVAGEAAGALALFAGEKDFFHKDEMRLLTGLADEVAFAIDHIEKQERIDYLAYYDVLTGLANRSLFLERVAQYLRGAAAGGHRLAVYLLDLDRFRNINDSLGRPAGDTLLRQVGEWLTGETGDAGVVARVGADRFAVVLPRKLEGDALRRIEEMIGKFLEHAFRLNDAVFRVSAKVGAAIFPGDGDDAETLFKHAEAALKKAKASGERYLFYTPSMTQIAAGQPTLEHKLRQALDRGEFVLHYQPKVSLASGKLTGGEALIRWDDPLTGQVPPGRFIQVLEETGLIQEVGRWALRQAIEDNLRWRAAGHPPVRIAVNVSPQQLRNRGFIRELEQAIGIDPNAAAGLELEITESLIMEDVRHGIATLQAIRAMGITIAIDDFGTGFSSLSYLARLPVDALKIDRSFVDDMTTGAQGLALMSTIINLAHALKLRVVAEGVEAEDQSRLLRLLNCDEMQGFLLSPGVPAAVFEARFLAA
ncbi:MAG TPA: EAL domain-containing protein [Solimonas sp.]|nr:EAL domain-containing protein [Solimonas sp.]